MPTNSSELELFHYGIKGMKWGVRRKRGDDGRVNASPAPRPRGSADYEETRRVQQKPVYKMSNQELQRVNQRLQLERQYNQLTSSSIQSGEAHVKKALSTITLANNVYSAYKSPVGQMVVKTVKNQVFKRRKSSALALMP